MIHIEKTETATGPALKISGAGEYKLADTLECGQCFRFYPLPTGEYLSRYAVMRRGEYTDVAQMPTGELLFFGTDEESFEEVWRSHFALDSDLASIREDILSRTSSDWLRNAAASAGGIAILKQDPWETLFSFIVSQNNNIPRIKKILRSVSLEYGTKCQQKVTNDLCSDSSCDACGACYSFPSPEDILENPEKLLPSHPGFRYPYLIDAARAVLDGRVNFDELIAAHDYKYSLECLKRIKGVGDKVASCVALFSLGNYDAFPIDVWMRRAIDEYFDGRLDPSELGPYAGVAQQYIFHYIRNISNGA